MYIYIYIYIYVTNANAPFVSSTAPPRTASAAISTSIYVCIHT